jgi:hypothetical protein
MSLRRKTGEIRRLIDSFSREADKFHDITFSLFYVANDGPVEDKEFKSPNHTIMLWQYYGKIDPQSGINSFAENLKDSDLKWGVRGAKISAFAVIEGDSCGLFSRMAKRAGSLFSEKEAKFLKSRVVSEIQKAEIDGLSTPAAVVNDNDLAVWLSYLLYYISKVRPEKDVTTRIEPDPYSLSLLVLEDLLESQKIDKIDRSSTSLDSINFKVAVSFSGEHRGYVSKVVDFLKDHLGKDQIFYDFDYQSQLARPNLDILLQKVYRDNSDLIVVFLCKEYLEGDWCGLEWRCVRDIVKAKDNDKVMFVRFDDAQVDGLLSIDGYIDASRVSEYKLSEMIMDRVKVMSPE